VRLVMDHGVAQVVFLVRVELRGEVRTLRALTFVGPIPWFPVTVETGMVRVGTAVSSGVIVMAMCS